MKLLFLWSFTVQCECTQIIAEAIGISNLGVWDAELKKDPDATQPESEPIKSGLLTAKFSPIDYKFLKSCLQRNENETHKGDILMIHTIA